VQQRSHYRYIVQVAWIWGRLSLFATCLLPLSASLMLAQNTPPPQPMIAYPDSPEGLKHYVDDLRSTFQLKGTAVVPNRQNEVVVPDSKIDELHNVLVIPNHASWFTDVFGQVGVSLDAAYDQDMHYATLAMFGAFGFDKSTYHVVRLQEIASAKRTLDAMKKPTSAYAIVVNGGNLFGGYYFFYSDERFYPVFSRDFAVLDISSPRNVPQEVQLLSQVPLVYPPLARQARIQGNVVLHVIVDPDGRVKEVTLISGHPLLVQAAIDSVRQWRYKPTLLNGTRVAVDTRATVTFTLENK
jgi:TonB family protein